VECKYGCGQIGKYQLKSGDWICSPSANQCPEMRRRNSIGSKKVLHSWRSAGPKGRHWNSPFKGLTYIEIYGEEKSEIQRAKISKALKGKATGKAKTEEGELLRRKKISESKNIGGYRKESGRGKHGWYKGFWCCSSWELAWVVYNLDHGIEFRQCDETFEYLWNGGIHKYKPDFIQGTKYIEIKGYFTGQFLAKASQFKKQLVILTYKDLKNIIQYVIDKYGKDYIKLYGTVSESGLRNSA
jgi:hypothetical protein